MEKSKVRILFYLTNEFKLDIPNKRDFIVRAGSNFWEIDGKFKNLDDGVNFARRMDSPLEMCILTPELSPDLDRLDGVRIQVEYGINLMREEKYWLGHEKFEGLWKHFKGDLSKFFHGIVLLCVSMVHFQMGHEKTALRIFENARKELKLFMGLKVDEWEVTYPLGSTIIDDIAVHNEKIIEYA